MKRRSCRWVASLALLGTLAAATTDALAQTPAASATPENPPAEPAPSGNAPAENSRNEGSDRGPRGFGGREGFRPDPQAIAEMMLRRFDKDGDQKLDTTELASALEEMRGLAGGFGGGPGPFGGGPGPFGGGPGGGPFSVTRMFDDRDADKDGKLAGDEIPERLRPMLSRLDANSDGSIDREEVNRLGGMFGGRGGRDAAPAEGNRQPRRPAAEE